MAAYSSILAWKIPWTEDPGRLSPWGRKELDTTEQFHFHFSLLGRDNNGEGHHMISIATTEHYSCNWKEATDDL